MGLCGVRADMVRSLSVGCRRVLYVKIFTRFRNDGQVAFLLLLIEKIFSWAGRKFSLGRE